MIGVEFRGKMNDECFDEGKNWVRGIEVGKEE